MAGCGRSELLRELRDVLRQVPHAPRRNDILKHADHHPSTFKREFGSTEAALEATDIPTYNVGKNIPLETLLDDVHRVADVVGRRPRTSDVDEYGEYTVETYMERCGGTWNGVIEAAGFEPIPDEVRITREELLEELERLYEQFDAPPTRWTIRFYGVYSTTPYDREFDGWQAALTAADIPTSRYRISTDELVEELRRVADELGRPPTGPDIEEHAAYSSSTYYNRFGTLPSAHAAAGLDSASG